MTNGANVDSWASDVDVAVWKEFRPYGVSVEDDGTHRAITRCVLRNETIGSYGGGSEEIEKGY